MLVKAKTACVDNITGKNYPVGMVFELPKARAEKAIKAGYVEKLKEDESGTGDNQTGEE